MRNLSVLFLPLPFWLLAHMLLPVMAESMTFLTFAILISVSVGYDGLCCSWSAVGLLVSAIAMGRYPVGVATKQILVLQFVKAKYQLSKFLHKD